MVKMTLIARVADGLPLAEGLDTDKSHELDQFKQQAKVVNCAASPVVALKIFSLVAFKRYNVYSYMIAFILCGLLDDQFKHAVWHVEASFEPSVFASSRCNAAAVWSLLAGASTCQISTDESLSAADIIQEDVTELVAAKPDVHGDGTLDLPLHHRE